MARNVAIMVFDDAEVLDFCGPFEVFAVTRDRHDLKTPLFNVYTIAEKAGPVIARNGLSVNPSYGLENCPAPDIFLVPGGLGTRREVNNPALINWIRQQEPASELVLSVCTGAFLLAKAGLLDGLDATTHHVGFEMLQELAPTARLHPGERFTDNGRVLTSAGISAGIDMALYVVAKLHGVKQALHTARSMEYEIRPEHLAARVLPGRT